jgi:hypothetical protein
MVILARKVILSVSELSVPHYCIIEGQISSNKRLRKTTSSTNNLSQTPLNREKDCFYAEDTIWV